MPRHASQVGTNSLYTLNFAIAITMVAIPSSSYRSFPPLFQWIAISTFTIYAINFCKYTKRNSKCITKSFDYGTIEDRLRTVSPTLISDSVFISQPLSPYIVSLIMIVVVTPLLTPRSDFTIYYLFYPRLSKRTWSSSRLWYQYQILQFSSVLSSQYISILIMVIIESLWGLVLTTISYMSDVFVYQLWKSLLYWLSLDSFFLM